MLLWFASRIVQAHTFSTSMEPGALTTAPVQSRFNLLRMSVTSTKVSVSDSCRLISFLIRIYLICFVFFFISTTEAAFYHAILLNRTFRVVLTTATVGICLPMIFYLVFYSREWGSGFQPQEYGTCGYYDVYHLPCGIEVLFFLIFTFYIGFFCVVLLRERHFKENEL